jgi:hypothetical protein
MIFYVEDSFRMPGLSLEFSFHLLKIKNADSTIFEAYYYHKTFTLHWKDKMYT